MKHELPKLPWQADALTGAISATTIDFHYGKHTRTYLENVDKLAAETPLSELPLDGIVRVADGALLNNAAQAWNHLFYFDALSPSPKPASDKAFLAAVERCFGSVDVLKTKMEQSGAALFGSGWTWLVADSDNHLMVINTPNADTPLRMDGLRPCVSTCGSTRITLTIRIGVLTIFTTSGMLWTGRLWSVVFPESKRR